MKYSLFTAASMAIFAVAISGLAASAQPSKPIKKGAHCACAKELFGIELINGRCRWPSNLANQINECALKKSASLNQSFTERYTSLK